MPACPTKEEIDPRFTIEHPAEGKMGGSEGARVSITSIAVHLVKARMAALVAL